jgi:hypothetical protein
LSILLIAVNGLITQLTASFSHCFFVLTWLVASIIKLSLLSTFFTLSFYAALSELGQYYLGFRNAEFSDFYADIAGISLYLLLKYAYLKYKIFTLKRIIKVKQTSKVQQS